MEKIHPFCTLHYTDAYALIAFINAAKKWCPELEDSFNEWTPKTCESLEDFNNIIEGLKDDADCIFDHLNWTEKNA